MSNRPATSTANAGIPHRGFTLLEVLLTLLLTSLVLVALAMAVDFQLRVVDKSRGNVEEAQLARVLLHRIANDLRGAVAYDPLEMEKLVQEAVSSAAGSVEGAISAAAGSAEGATESASEGAADKEASQQQDSDLEDVDDSQSEETDAEAESAVPRSVPGVYGESDWLQVDVSRLPRLDQFQYLVSSTEGSTTVDRLSDVKTVSYYVIASEDGGGYAEDGTASSGLVRRELDRAVSSWASDQGQLDQTDSDVTPIAPEVSAIEFSYSDGTEWVDSWDSDEAGALPVAVQITLTITPNLVDDSQSSSLQMSTDAIASEEEEYSLTYRLVVHLLAAEASSGEDETYDETYDEAEASGTESGSSESGSPGEEPTR